VPHPRVFCEGGPAQTPGVGSAISRSDIVLEDYPTHAHNSLRRIAGFRRRSLRQSASATVVAEGELR
jgi:hypothetical protein